MPTYCYEDPTTGAIIERVFPMGMASETIRCGDVFAFRCLRAEIAGQTASVKGTDNPVIPRRKNWPLKCVASGVHPEQAQELRDHYKKHGLNIHVDKEGDPHYEDASQRRKGLKSRQMHDRNDHFG